MLSWNHCLSCALNCFNRLRLLSHNNSSQRNISEFICYGALRSNDVWADWQNIRLHRWVHISDQVASGVKLKAGMCSGPSWPLPSIGQLLGSVWAVIGYMSHLKGPVGVFYSFFSFYYFLHRTAGLRMLLIGMCKSTVRAFYCLIIVGSKAAQTDWDSCVPLLSLSIILFSMNESEEGKMWFISDGLIWKHMILCLGLFCIVMYIYVNN